MAGSQGALGPFKLRASLHETIWGGQRLRAVAGKPLPEGARIGEAWETALDSVVSTPPHTGQTLGALVKSYGEALLGARAIAVYGRRFPLLAKFLDAHDWLSVQAHPDDAYAAAHEGGKLGKTETWYILAAEPGAQIVYGFRDASDVRDGRDVRDGLAREVSRATVREAITANALEPLLRTVEVRAGDVVFVPAGTVHAIGAGVALYELQEYSDVTYRLYDYGRLQANGQPRELHIERALDVIRYAPSPTITVAPTLLPGMPAGVEAQTLVACRYFVEQELRFVGVGRALRQPALPSSCQILTVLRGEAQLVSAAGEGFEPLRLAHGETAVLPATLGETTVMALSDETRVMRSYVPEADDEALLLWQRTHEGLFPAD